MRSGAAWLITDTDPGDVFTPERLSEEHRLIARTAQEFVANEVAPALTELEKKNWTVARTLVARAGELGLIGVDVPEALGGVGLDKAAAVVVGEAVGEAASLLARTASANQAPDRTRCPRMRRPRGSPMARGCSPAKRCGLRTAGLPT